MPAPARYDRAVANAPPDDHDVPLYSSVTALLAVVYHNLANVDLERGDLEAAQRNSTKAHDLFVQLLGEQPMALSCSQ